MCYRVLVLAALLLSTAPFAAPESAPVSMPVFKSVWGSPKVSCESEGCSPITTEANCKLAGEELYGSNSLYHRSDSPGSQHDPPHCYTSNGYTHYNYNRDQSGPACWRYAMCLCLCEVDAPSAPANTNATHVRINEGHPYSERGGCSARAGCRAIANKTQCEAAVRTRVEIDSFSVVDRDDVPAGCIDNQGDALFNTHNGSKTSSGPVYS